MTSEGSNTGQSTWCARHVGQELTDALWPHLQIAEAQRLTRVFGYPKDNAVPEHIQTRLAEGRFCADVRASVLDDEGEPQDERALLDALEVLIKAAGACPARG